MVHGQFRPGNRRARWWIAMAAGMPLFAAGPVQAQRLLDQFIAADIPGTGVESGVTVVSRARPDYDSLGVRLGEITIRPELLESIGFDDNVLGRPSRRGSAVVETNARVQALYDHSDTTAFATLTVDDNRYPEQTQQSFTNWTAAIGGSHQFGRDTLSLTYEHLNLNQTVRDLDVPQLDRSLQFQVDTGRLAYRAVFNRLAVTPALDVSAFAFENGTVAGQPFLQTYRDRVVVQPSVALSYELAPLRNLTLVLRDSVASYSNQIAGTPRRDFNDVAVLAGLDFDEGIFRYRLLAGLESRTFSSAQIKTITAPVVEGEVIWNPTGLTTVTATGSRRILDSSDETTVAVTASDVQLRVDHELQRDVLLRAVGSAAFNEYGRGQGSQQLFSAGAGATKLLNRNLKLDLDYTFTRRLSNGTGNLGVIIGQQFGQSYSEDQVLLRVRFAL